MRPHVHRPHPLAGVQQLLEQQLDPTGTEGLGDGGHARAALGACCARGHRRVFTHEREHQRRAHVPEERIEKRWLLSLSHGQGREEAGRIRCEDGAEDRLHGLVGPLPRQALRVGEARRPTDQREQLIREGERIAHAPASEPRDLRGDPVFRRDLLCREDLVEACLDLRLGQRREAEDLAPGDHRVRDLV